MMYIILCVVWLTYFVIDLSTQIGKKKKLETPSLSYEYDHLNRKFTCNEKIIRESIIVTFFCFEVAYGLVLISAWPLDNFNAGTISVPISSSSDLYRLDCNRWIIIDFFRFFHVILSIFVIV